MKLTEMLGQYEELLDKKDQLAEDTKDNNAAIDKLKAEIAEMMIDRRYPIPGIRRLRLQPPGQGEVQQAWRRAAHGKGPGLLRGFERTGTWRPDQRDRQPKIPAERDEGDRPTRTMESSRLSSMRS